MGCTLPGSAPSEVSEFGLAEPAIDVADAGGSAASREPILKNTVSQRDRSCGTATWSPRLGLVSKVMGQPPAGSRCRLPRLLAGGLLDAVISFFRVKPGREEAGQRGRERGPTSGSKVSIQDGFGQHGEA